MAAVDTEQVDIRIAVQSSWRVPVVGASETPVAVVTHACHERTIDQGLAELAVPGLDRATLEGVLTYCAEERCIADDASCPGCRRRTQVEGIASFDDFAKFNAVYRESFPTDPPARATVQVAALNDGARIELQMIAVKP